MLSTSVSLKMLNDFQPKDLPQPPKEYSEYKMLPESMQKRNAELFFKQQHIIDFIDKKWEAEFYNYNSIFKLKDLANLTNDPNVLRAIGIKIAQFKQKIQGVRYPFKSLDLKFERKQYEAEEWTE